MNISGIASAHLKNMTMGVTITRQTAIDAFRGERLVVRNITKRDVIWGAKGTENMVELIILVLPNIRYLLGNNSIFPIFFGVVHCNIHLIAINSGIRDSIANERMKVMSGRVKIKRLTLVGHLNTRAALGRLGSTITAISTTARSGVNGRDAFSVHQLTRRSTTAKVDIIFRRIFWVGRDRDFALPCSRCFYLPTPPPKTKFSARPTPWHTFTKFPKYHQTTPPQPFTK